MGRSNELTVDDVTTTNTIDVWRNKLNREERYAPPRRALWTRSKYHTMLPAHFLFAVDTQGKGRMALPVWRSAWARAAPRTYSQINAGGTKPTHSRWSVIKDG